MNKSSVSSYRPEIDGLRAIAVLSVIIFHIEKVIILYKKHIYPARNPKKQQR